MTFLAGFAAGDRGVLATDTRASLPAGFVIKGTGQSYTDAYSKLRPLHGGWLASTGAAVYLEGLCDRLGEYSAGDAHAMSRTIRAWSATEIPRLTEQDPSLEFGRKTSLIVLDATVEPFRVRRFGTDGKMAEGASVGTYPPDLPLPIGDELVATVVPQVGTADVPGIVRLMARLILDVYEHTGRWGTVSDRVELGLSEKSQHWHLPPTRCADVLTASDTEIVTMLKRTT